LGSSREYTVELAYPIQRHNFLQVDSRQGFKLSTAVEYAKVTNKEIHVSHLTIHAGNRRANSAWAKTQPARPGGDLEPDPALQSDLQALLLDLG
jgi:hypothetical protein